jgi:hypothetical protein
MSYTLNSTETAEINIIPSNQRSIPKDNFSRLSSTGESNDYDVNQIDIPSKGCLLIGAVYSFRNMPKDTTNSNAYSFFRILYSEGSSKSSLMNARIPILTSSSLYYDDVLQWDENNTFKLEIPTAHNQLQGEIIVSVYKTKKQGGNELVGQLVFSLSSINSSTVSNSRSSEYESRIVQGVFPLTTKPDSAAEVDLHFQLVWDKNSIKPYPAVIPIKIGASKDDSISQDQPNSSRLSRSQSSSSRPQSVGRAATASNAIRKIASSGLKKKREDQLRIERENKVMQSRLLKLATSRSNPSIAKNSNANAYAPNPSPIAKPSVSKNDGMSVGNKSKAVLSDKELSDQLNKVKQDIIDKTNENANLRGQINKLKSQSAKFQQANERIKKTVAMTSESSTDVQKQASKEKSIPAAVTVRSDKAWIFREYYLDESSVKQRELLDMIDEHFELQNIRRGLVRRIEAAKKSLSTNGYQIKRSEENRQVLIDRLKMLYPSYTGVQQLSASRGSDRSKLSDEIEIYHRLKSVKRDYQSLQAVYDEGLSSSKAKLDFEQKLAILQTMKEKKSLLQRRVSNALYERDLWQERLQIIQGNRSAFYVRDSLTKLKAVLLRLDREERISNLIISI